MELFASTCRYLIEGWVLLEWVMSDKLKESKKYIKMAVLAIVVIAAVAMAAYKIRTPKLPRWDALDYIMTAEWIAGKHVAFPSNEPLQGMVDARAPVVPYFVAWGFKFLGFKFSAGIA